MEKNTFSAYRLKKESIGRLQQIKIAYEAVYERKMTNDEFINHLVDCIDDGDLAVWEYYCQTQTLKSEAVEKKKK